MGTWLNFGETRSGVKKVGCWSTKAATSLKRVKIEEKLLWRAYRNSPTLFRTVPSRPLRPPLPQDWGFATPTPWQVISHRVDARPCNDFICRVNGALEIVSLLLLLLLLTPKPKSPIGARYYPRNGWSYGLQVWSVHLEGPFEQKPIKNFGEKGAWADPNVGGTTNYLRDG